MLMENVQKTHFNWKIPPVQSLKHGVSVYFGLHTNTYNKNILYG